MKILVLDIETSPHLSFHWRRWKENIPYANTVDESHIICWAAKWLGQKNCYFSSEWTQPDTMLERMWNLLDEADAVVHFNGKKFDVKRLNSEFFKAGWDAPSPYQQIDLLVQAKKHFAFSSNRLKDLLKELGLTPKLEENTDMELWMDVYWGKAEARKRMKAYNIQDVNSTEEFYNYMLGWIDPHPNWGFFVDDVSDPDNPVCPNCGKRHMKKHKVRVTRVRKYQQWQCQECGKYSRGRKHIGEKGVDNGIVT